MNSYDTDTPLCTACDGTGVGNGAKMGGFCKRCNGTGKPVAPKPAPEQTAGRSQRFFRGARIR